MKKIYLILFGAAFFLGILILLNCIPFANQEISNIMHANGGSMDTGKFLIVYEQSVIKFRVLGSLLSVLGGLGMLTAAAKQGCSSRNG